LYVIAVIGGVCVALRWMYRGYDSNTFRKDVEVVNHCRIITRLYEQVYTHRTTYWNIATAKRRRRGQQGPIRIAGEQHVCSLSIRAREQWRTMRMLKAVPQKTSCVRYTRTCSLGYTINTVVYKSYTVIKVLRRTNTILFFRRVRGGKKSTCIYFILIYIYIYKKRKIRPKP